MRVAAACLGEGLPTNPTLVGLFPCVRQLMFLEAGHLSKPFAAALKLAGIRPLPCVCPDVVLQVSSCCEGLGAFRVRADKWPLPRVHAAMNIQVLGGIEAFSAAWELALARAIRDVDLLDV